MAEKMVFDKVQRLIESSPGVAAIEVASDTSIADLGLDSLRLLEIVFELEKHFCVEVDEAALVEVASVGDLALMISTQLSEASRDR
jgi:acyl carrier protein